MIPDPLRSAVYSIPANDREIWLAVGAALKTEFGDDGYSLWREWSKTSKKYNPSVTRVQWNSLKPGIITQGTIFYHAARYGWKGEKVYQKHRPHKRRHERQEVETTPPAIPREGGAFVICLRRGGA